MQRLSKRRFQVRQVGPQRVTVPTYYGICILKLFHLAMASAQLQLVKIPHSHSDCNLECWIAKAGTAESLNGECSSLLVQQTSAVMGFANSPDVSIILSICIGKLDRVLKLDRSFRLSAAKHQTEAGPTKRTKTR
eukprot:RCo018890